MSTPRRAKPYVGIADVAKDLPSISDRVSKAEWELQKRIDTARGGDPATYVFKIGLEQDDYDWIALQFGQHLRLLLHDRSRWDGAINDARRLLACTLTLTATSADSEVAFWREFWRTMGLDRVHAFESHIRANLDRVFRTSNLHAFTDLDLGSFPYVTACTLHAGFQTANLLPLTDAIHELLDERGEVNGESQHGKTIASWYRSSADAPVGLRHFSTHVPDAVLIFDRIIEFVSYTRMTPGWFNEESFEGTNGIPAALFSALRSVLASRTGPTGKPALGKKKGLRPRLKFDIETASVHLALPEIQQESVRHGASANWILDFGNQHRTITPEPGPGGGFRSIDVALPEPVEVIHVKQEGTGQVWNVVGLPDSGPLLLFRSSGTALRNQNSIGASKVVAAAPTATEFTLENASGEWADIQASSLRMQGWPGWSLFELSLEGARALEAHFPNGQTTMRQLARNAEASFDTTGLAVKGLFAASGEPVLAGSPVLTVPDGDEWSVSIYYVEPPSSDDPEAAEESLTLIQEFDIEEEDENAPLEVFNPGFDDAWVGVYQVTLKRSGMTKISPRFAMAEGISVRASYTGHHGDFQIPEPSHGKRCSTPMQFALENLKNKDLRFTTGFQAVTHPEEGLPVSISTPDGYCLDAVYRPDFLRFTVDRSDGVRRWSHSLSNLDLESLDLDGKLTVRFPERVHNVSVRFVDHSGNAVAGELGLSRMGRNSHSWICSTSQLVRTFGDGSKLLMILSWDHLTKEEQFQRLHPNPRRRDWGRFDANYKPITSYAPIFDINRPPLIESATLISKASGDEIRLVPGRRQHKELLAWAWPLLAPYRSVTLSPSFDLESGSYRAPLPEELTMAGPLLIDVREGGFLVDDAPPPRPTEKALLAAQPSLWLDTDDAESRIANYLADIPGTQLAPEDSSTFWKAVDMLSAIVSLRDDESPRALRNVRWRINDAIRSNPRNSLSEMGRSNIDVHQQPGLFIGSGLVVEEFTAEETFNEYHSIRWIGLLEEMNDLVALRRHARESEDRMAEREMSIDYISNAGGQALVSALAKGQDQLANFLAINDADLEALDSGDVPAVQSNYEFHLRDVSGTTPEIIAPQRIKAQIELMNARARINEISDTLKELLRFAERREELLVKSNNQNVLKTARTLGESAAEGKEQGRLWMAVPYVSYVLSVLARMEAHGRLYRLNDLHEALPNWRVLASHVPALTRFDIIMAEAIALHAAHGDLTANIILNQKPE